MNKKIILVSTLTVIILGALLFYFNNNTNIIKSTNEDTTENIKGSSIQYTGNCDEEYFQCGTTDKISNECFLEAAKNCCKARVVTERDIIVEGETIQFKGVSVIHGFEGDKCRISSGIIEGNRESLVGTCNYDHKFLIYVLEKATKGEQPIMDENKVECEYPENT